MDTFSFSSVLLWLPLLRPLKSRKEKVIDVIATSGLCSVVTMDGWMDGWMDGLETWNFPHRRTKQYDRRADSK